MYICESELLASPLGLSLCVYNARPYMRPRSINSSLSLCRSKQHSDRQIRIPQSEFEFILGKCCLSRYAEHMLFCEVRKTVAEETDHIVTSRARFDRCFTHRENFIFLAIYR
jgi:hypothetical protein